MLGYHKKTFDLAHNILHGLKKTPGDLSLLIELQRILITKISSIEAKIRIQKNNKADNALRPKRKFNTENRIERLRQTIYIWKSFGDAVAFLYLDKYALKQTFFNADNTNIRNNSGFLGDKAGLLAEVNFLKTAIDAGIPALLTDLTNTIRHGDVCLMAGPDPHLVEVKSGKKLNPRGKKQIKNIQKIHDFYKNDHTEELRGAGEAFRLEQTKAEIIYIEDINQCIKNAYTDGYATKSPEKGLFYLAIKDKNFSFETLSFPKKMKKPWIFTLNEYKNERKWQPYMPFTLSILEREHLYDFIRGDLFITVMVDIDQFCVIAKKKGYIAKINDESEFIIDLSDKTGAQKIKISQQLLVRTGVEFLSINSLVDFSIEALNRGYQLKKEPTPSA